MNHPDPAPDHLQQFLRRLHVELAQTPRVDDASRQLLRDVLNDIERVLRQGVAAAASTPPAAASLSRLEALAVDFEADRPALAASRRQFVDLRGPAGL